MFTSVSSILHFLLTKNKFSSSFCPHWLAQHLTHRRCSANAWRIKVWVGNAQAGRGQHAQTGSCAIVPAPWVSLHRKMAPVWGARIRRASQRRRGGWGCLLRKVLCLSLETQGGFFSGWQCSQRSPGRRETLEEGGLEEGWSVRVWPGLRWGAAVKVLRKGWIESYSRGQLQDATPLLCDSLEGARGQLQGF